MSQFVINIIFVGLSFALYFGIAIWARAGSTSEFYVAGGGVHPVLNGMATVIYYRQIFTKIIFLTNKKVISPN